MRKLDFALQTILLVLAVLFLVAGAFIDKVFFILIGLVQFFMGCLQLLSAFVTTVNKKHNDTYRKNNMMIYWMLVLAYFLILATLYCFSTEGIALVWFCAAWGIAIYYYVFTIRLAFSKNTERKTFLDIAN